MAFVEGFVEVKTILLRGISQAQKRLPQSFSGVRNSYIHTYIHTCIYTDKYMYVYERGPLRRGMSKGGDGEHVKAIEYICQENMMGTI